jgi:tetratricopeptide (TPR) repeat protein
MRRTVITPPTLRHLVALLVVSVLGIWQPDSLEPQTLDLVAQGRQALDTGRIDEAIALLEKAVADDPRNPAALAWLGSAQVRKAGQVPGIEAAGWVKRGFEALDEAVERFPDTFVVYVVRGMTAGRVPDMFNKREVAVKDLTAVVTMKERRPQAVPDSVMPAVYLNLGLIQKKAGRPAEARAAWEKAKRLYPAAPEMTTIDRELRGL